MGIFSRLAQLIQSNLNDLISRSEDPEKMLNQVVLDMNNQLVEAKKQVAASIADEKRLAKQYEQEAANAQEWERRAMMALRAGNEPLAKEGLARKREHDELAATYQEQWTKQKAAVDQLKKALRLLSDKIEEAKRKRNVLVARKKRAGAQKALQETMSGLRDHSAFETFDRMAQKIDQLEAEAEAQGEIAEELTGDALATQFQQLEHTHSAEEDLVALKRKMGILPPVEAGAPAQAVQARVEAGPSPAKSEQDEVAAALEELEVEQQQQEEKRKGGRWPAPEAEVVAAVAPLNAEKRSSSVLVHSESPDALIERLDTDPARGLAQAEALARLARNGPNELPTATQESAALKLLAQFANPIVITLLVAAVIAIVNGASQRGQPLLVRFGDATAILLIVVLNAVLGFVQERRAEAALDALAKMQTPNARVRRDDEVRVIAASQVVVGDVLELQAGDAVAADARLLQTIDLAAEESSLTGESSPAQKDARAAVADDAPLADRPTMLFVGTTLVRGKGRAVVVATGARTELGQLSVLVNRPRDRTTPLEERLDSFGKRILWTCLALSALLFVRGMFKGDRSWHELLLEAVSLAVAAIPEGLPAITTITLALGMQRMAKRGAIIRKLSAVETLGSATVICTDKTGTLTQNQMTVREVYCGGARFAVTGEGYDPTGFF